MRLLLLLFWLFPAVVLAQGARQDSLSIALTHATSDSAKVRLHIALSRQFSLSDVPKARYHAEAAAEIARKIDHLPGLVTALYQQGHLHLVLGEFDKSLAMFYKALKVGQQAQDTALLVSTYSSLGVLNKKTKDEARALQNFAIAEDLAKKTGNSLGLSKIYNNLGTLYDEKRQYKTALAYFKKAAQLQKQMPDKRVYAVVLQNIGEIYIKLNQPAVGRTYLFQALQMDQEIQNKMNLPVTLGTLAGSYLAEKKYAQAEGYALQAFEIATETGSSKKISAAAKLMERIYAAQHNYEQAYKYQTIYARHQEELDAQSQHREAAEITARFENEKRDIETFKLKAEKENQANRIKHQKVVLGLSLAFLLLMLIVVVELYLRRKGLKATNLELQVASHKMQSQNAEIMRQKEEIEQQRFALQVQNEQLEKHNHFKSKVFSIVSHDLRSPFTTIQGVLELGNSNSLSNQDMQRIFGLLSKDVDVVLEMLNNILVWSKSQMEGEAMQVQPLKVLDLVEDCVQLVACKASEKFVRLENLVPVQAVVLADRERLAFIIRNLIMNALKFSYRGDKVVLSAFEENDKWVFQVTDTGKGISEKHLKKLFSNERFTTLGTSQEVGTGLGLMLCKELLESLGGSISVESTLGKGTTFSVSLPKAARLPVEKEDKKLACA